MRALLLFLAAGALIASEPGPMVTAQVPWGNPDRYLPVVVQVQTPDEGRFRIEANVGSASASTEVDIQAGATRTLTLLLPGHPETDPYVQVRWKGPKGRSGALTANAMGGQRWRALAVIDRDERLPLTRFAFVEKSSWATRTGYGTDFVARVPLEALPQRWQGYPGQMALLLAPGDDRRLDDERRAAIATWAAFGGTVAVAEAAQVPAWRALGVTPVVLDGGDEKALKEAIEADGAIDHQEPPLRPVPGTERVPATGFAIIALVFAIVVGPLNLWWVRKRGNRHLLLITTPIVSLATCVGLLVANLLIEGVALHRQVQQVTVLDQERAQALAWTRCTYYGGFAVSALALDPEACARDFADDSHLDWRARRHGRSGSNELAIDWSSGQRLLGWVPARTNRQLLFTAPRPERSRLTVSRSGEDWQVTNGLGQEITTIAWRDRNGAVWTAAGVASGGVGRMEKSGDTFVGSDAVGELDGSAKQVVRRVTAAPYGFQATLAAPFGALPGPEARDAAAPRCVVVGHAIPPGATP